MDTLSASDQGTITEPRQAPAFVAQAAIATPHARHEKRGLLQSSTAPVEVSSAAELVLAVKQGARDIIITEHLDLTTQSLK